MTLSPNQIHQGDCVEKLAEMEAGSIDLVFADPPFNIGYSYDVYDDQQTESDYLQFCRRWISGCHRALKPDGSFWLAIGDEYAAELKLMSQETGFHCRSWVIWYYTFGVNCVRGFSRSHTHLFHFVKDPNAFTFNGDNPTVRVPSARQLVYADARANAKGRLPDNTWILRPQDAPPMGFSPSHDTWYYARVAGTFKEREGFHGCQMPEQLLGRIIRISSNPGDLVMDPFGGSGTTLVVAKKLGRQFMGVELSEEYAQRITERLECCEVGEPLDGPADPINSAPSTSKGKSRTEFRNGRPVIVLTPDIKRSIDDAFHEAGIKFAKELSFISAEEVLCDPERNQRFGEACKAAGLLGDRRTWNEHLLELSRNDQLADEGAPEKRSLKLIEPFCDAAEVAFQMLSVDYAMDLDTILCSPDAAEEFDMAVNLFDTAASTEAAQPGAFRSAIWHLRRIATTKKVTTAAKKMAAEFLSQEPPAAVPITTYLEQTEDESQPVGGLYVLWDGDSVLFVGQSRDLRATLGSVCDSPGWQRFDLTAVEIWPIDDPKVSLIQRCLLVTQRKPWLNASFLHQPIATTLF